MRALITGATGLVGRRLLEKLGGAVVLSRDAERARKSLGSLGAECYSWSPSEESPPPAALEGVEAVFHLAGEPVAEGRWTAKKKVRLRESRVVGTRRLVDGLLAMPSPPKLLVSASAVGYYGNRGDEVLTESAAPEDDFLAEICTAWEAESHRAREAGIRVVNPRIGIVLANGGGALQKMLPPFKLGLGSPLGSGRQWMPWIHLDDLVGLMLHAVDHPQLDGPANGAAPHPVTNREFTKALGSALGRPTFMPAVPGFMLQLMLGEFGQILLHSQRCIPQAALDAGYEFQYSELDGALKNLLQKK